MQECTILIITSTRGIHSFSVCVLYAHCARSVHSSHDNCVVQQAAAGGLLRIAEAFIKQRYEFLRSSSRCMQIAQTFINRDAIFIKDLYTDDAHL